VERALPYGIGSVVVGAALLSALLHAAWNAAVRASPDPRSAMAAQVVGSGLLSIPLLMLVPLPSAAALPWLCGSACLNLMMLIALLRGYAHGGGFGFVYPLARATSPLLVLFLASFLQGEAVGPFGVAGIALVSAGIALFAFAEGRHQPKALAYALLAGACSAGYAICDGNGARFSSSVLGYGLTASIVNACVFGTLHMTRHPVPLRQALRSHLRVATIGTSAAILSYVLILWVWTQAPIAIGAALRDTSVVFAALIAAWLGEGLSPRRAGAIALATAGACLIRFA
jgi:drug/metabolite transporter (DMT)-like permease